MIVLATIFATFVTFSAFRDTAASPGGLVMVTGDGTTANGNDPAKRALFELWGWTVTAVDDSAGLAALAAAAGSNDVMFVSDTAGTDAFGLLRDLDIGIVNESFTYVSGLLNAPAGDQDFASETTLDLAAVTHPITIGFSTGSLTIHTTSQDVNYWEEDVTPLPADVTVLASAPATVQHAALFVAEAGAPLYSGSAVERRVWFPSDAADPASYTAEYEVLLERSLDWAASSSRPSAGDLLFVTGDGTATDPEDAARVTLLQSIGWTVTVIDDDAGLAALTSAAAANDVLYLSSTTFTGNTDLRGLDIGIVSEGSAAWRDLTYAGSFAVDVASTTDVDVVDTTEPPTAAFSAGTLSLLTTSDTLGFWNSSSLALPADASTPVQQFGNPDREFLVLFEAGDDLYGGNTAANRRALAGWGSSAAALWTADLETLVERTVEWAAGSCVDSDADGLCDTEEDANTDGDLDPTT
ncbi:MAG: hypothetical protein AAGG08_21685, partial [Actinomycetota bacterium]